MFNYKIYTHGEKQMHDPGNLFPDEEAYPLMEPLPLRRPFAHEDRIAGQEHLDILKRGVDEWNRWRQEHSGILPGLRGADLSDAHLGGADLSQADLSQAYLSWANLSGANLSGANLSEALLWEANLKSANLKSANLKSANLSSADLSEADLNSADLSEADLSYINLRRAHLNKANLQEADLLGAYLSWTDFSDADLKGANLFGAYLREANLSRAKLSGANLSRANFFWPDIRPVIATDGGYKRTDMIPDQPTVPPEGEREKTEIQYEERSWNSLSGANLSGADLSRANLSGADLSRANLSGADLRGANLSWANLSGANLNGADITGCLVYATSAWDVLLEETIQDNLLLTAPADPGVPSITVDNLEIAQFLYLLLNNQKIRNVIDTITSKVVLILGRFTPERKAILEAIREMLRQKGYISILFDFDKPSSQDLTETVSTLAHLSRFIIVDLTDPSSAPYEIGTIASNHIRPIQALFQPSSEAKRVFAMFPDLLRRYHWVLPPYEYQDQEHLLASLQKEVIEPAERKAQELETR